MDTEDTGKEKALQFFKELREEKDPDRFRVMIVAALQLLFEVTRERSQAITHLAGVCSGNFYNLYDWTENHETGKAISSERRRILAEQFELNLAEFDRGLFELGIAFGTPDHGSD